MNELTERRLEIITVGDSKMYVGAQGWCKGDKGQGCQMAFFPATFLKMAFFQGCGRSGLCGLKVAFFQCFTVKPLNLHLSTVKTII